MRALKFLIVEDNADLRLNIQDALELLGHTAIHAENGLEALNCLSDRESRPDIILCDLSMPILDGLQFIEFARNEAMSDIPILVITGDDQDIRRENSLKLGANALLAKPFTLTELIETAEALLEQYHKGKTD